MIFALILVVLVVIVALVASGRARAVGPAPQPARIDSFDVQPRYVCGDEFVTASWHVDGETGIITATVPGPLRPFFSQNLDPLVAEDRVGIEAITSGDFVVELTVRRRGAASATQSITIRNMNVPNGVFTFTAQPAFTLDPDPGWINRQSFVPSGTGGVQEGWSPRITVVALRYREADGRPITVRWNGIELATLEPTGVMRDHMNAEAITVVGEWMVFAPARAGEGPGSASFVISVDLLLRCVAA